MIIGVYGGTPGPSGMSEYSGDNKRSGTDTFEFRVGSKTSGLVASSSESVLALPALHDTSSCFSSLAKLAPLTHSPDLNRSKGPHHKEHPNAS